MGPFYDTQCSYQTRNFSLVVSDFNNAHKLGMNELSMRSVSII